MAELRTATESLAAARSAGDTAKTGKALLAVAQAHVNVDNPGAAADAAQEAAKIFSELGSKADEAESLACLANAHMLGGANVESQQSANQAAKIFESLGDKKGKAGALQTLASALTMMGMYRKAIAAANEAIALLTEAGETEAAAALEEFKESIPGAAFKDWKVAGNPADSVISKDALANAVGRKKKPPADTIYHSDISKTPPYALPQPPIQCVIWGMCLGADGVPTQTSCDFAKYCCDISSSNLTCPIIIPTRGVYGRQTGAMMPPSLNDASGIAIWGMVRTARQEMPKIPMVMMDFPWGSASAEICRGIAPTDAEAVCYHDTKFLPKIEQVESLFRRDVRRDNFGGGGKQSGPKFQRRAFKFGIPAHKLDYCWYRQSWVAAGGCKAPVE